MLLATIVLALNPSMTLLPITNIVDQMPRQSVVSAKVRCAIHASKDDAGTRLDAVISGNGPVSGTFAFRVEPHGGGTPLFDEHGNFEIESTAPSEVKRAGLDLPADQSYDASLSIVWPNGSASCKASTS